MVKTRVKLYFHRCLFWMHLFHCLAFKTTRQSQNKKGFILHFPHHIKHCVVKHHKHTALCIQMLRQYYGLAKVNLGNTDSKDTALNMSYEGHIQGQ